MRAAIEYGLFPTRRITATLGAGLALGIFAVDVATPTNFAVAVLYVVVVLLAGSCCRRRGILLAAAGCMSLTVLSYGLTHTFLDDRDALLRCVVSLAAIAITTMLVLRNETVTAALAERASLLDLTHDTVSVRDMRNVITYWNKGAEQLYGWTRQEAVGRVMHDLLATAFPVPLQNIMAELLRTGRWEGELVHTAKDGRRLDMASRWHLQRDASGQPLSILETNNDIADRKLAEAVAARHRQDLQLTIDSIPAPVWSASPDGVLDFVNARWEETGYAKAELLRDWRSLAHPEDLVRVDAVMQAAWPAGEAFGFEVRLRRNDGTYRWHLGRAVPRRDESGAVTKWYGVSLDIEDRRQAEHALHEAQAKLAHLTRVTTMGELAASIAHEVNQPLAGIVTHGEAGLRWLNRDRPELDEVRMAMERIIGDGRRAAEVIRRLRALAKRAEISPAPHEVGDIVEDALALVQRELAKRRVSLDLELAADLPPVAADPVHLQQVFINLILNGAQAMEGVTGQPRLSIRAHSTGPGEVEVEFRDNGVGIDPKVGDRLFEPFYTTKADGMGMGLAISRTIVAAHDGRIWATSHEGGGTSFHVALPTVPAAGP